MRRRPRNRAADVIRQRDHRLDVKLATRDLTITVMARDLPACFDLGEHRYARRVVAENIERVFARMQTRLAHFDFTRVFVGLTNLILIASALHGGVESLVCRDDLGGLRSGLRGFLRTHQPSPLLNPPVLMPPSSLFLSLSRDGACSLLDGTSESDDSFPRSEVRHLDPIRIFFAALTSRS